MKILITQENYYPLYHGGTVEFVRWLANFLVKNKYQVQIFTRSYPEKNIVGPGIFDSISVEYSPFMVASMKEPFSVIKYVPEFIKFIKENNIDLVFSNNHNSLAWIMAARQAHVPVIYACHGVGLTDPLKKRYLLDNDDILWNFPSLYVCLKEIAGENISFFKKVLSLILFLVPFSIPERFRNYWRAKKAMDIIDSADIRYGNSFITKKLFRNQKNTFGFPLAINSSDDSLGMCYRPDRDDQYLQTLGLSHKSYVLCPGRIHHIKGQKYALDAFLQFKNSDIKLVFAGSNALFDTEYERLTPYEQSLRDIIKINNLESRVIFTGLCNFEQLKKLYTSALVSIIPSVWLETYGYVTVESMACETPVIVTSNCGSADCVVEGTGFIVERKRSMQIAEIINKYTKEDFIEMGKKARIHINNNYDWTVLGNKYVDMINLAKNICYK